jgi:hypothetical protein
LMQLHTHTIQGTVADLDPNFVLLDGGTGVGGAVFVGVGRSEDGTEFATIFRSVPREFTRNYGTKMDVGVGPIFNAPKPMKITRFGIVRPIHLPFPDPPVCPEGYRPGPTIYNDEPIACYLEHGGERDYRPWRLTVLPQHLQPEPSWPSDPWLDIDYLFKRDDADGVFFYQTNYISSFVGAIGPLNPHPDTVEVDVDFNSGESGFGITSMSESASDNPFPFTTVPFDLVGKALRVVDSTTRYVRAFNRWVGNVVAQKTSEGDDGFGTGVGWADFFGVLPKSYYWQVTAVVKRELGFGTSLKMTAFEDNNILLDSIHYPIGIDDPSDVVQLFWDAVPNAIEYHVYRNIGFDGHFDNVVVAYVAPQIDTQTGQQKQPQTFLDRGQQRRSPFGTDFTTIVNPSDGDRFCDGMKIKTSGTSVGFAGLRTFGVLSIDLLRLAPTRERLLTFVVLGAVSPSGKTASTGFVCDAAQNQIALLWAWDQPTLGGIVSAQPHDVSSFFIWISTTPNSNVSAIKITDLKAGDQRDSITTTVLKEGTNDDLIAWLYGSETVLGNNALWWWFFDDYFVYDAVKDKFVLIKKGGKLLADFTNPFVKFDEQLSKLWGLRPFPTYPPDKTPPLSAPREFAPNGLEFLVTNAAQVRHSIHILRHQQSFAEAGVPMPAQSPKPS